MKKLISRNSATRRVPALRLGSLKKMNDGPGGTRAQVRCEADVAPIRRRFGVEMRRRFRRHRHSKRRENRQYKYGNAERSGHSIQRYHYLLSSVSSNLIEVSAEYFWYLLKSISFRFAIRPERIVTSDAMGSRYR